jgi:hypothetical protein
MSADCDNCGGKGYFTRTFDNSDDLMTFIKKLEVEWLAEAEACESLARTAEGEERQRLLDHAAWLRRAVAQ